MPANLDECVCVCVVGGSQDFGLPLELVQNHSSLSHFPDPSSFSFTHTHYAHVTLAILYFWLVPIYSSSSSSSSFLSFTLPTSIIQHLPPQFQWPHTGVYSRQTPSFCLFGLFPYLHCSSYISGPYGPHAMF